MKSIFFLIQRFDKPSSRYRVLQFLPALKKAGIEVQVQAVSNQNWKRWQTLNQARKSPIVFIQKKLFNPLELLFLQSRGAKLIFDFDDAIHFRHHPPGASSFTRTWLFKMMMKKASVVLAGNLYLLQEAKKANAHAQLLPTLIDLEKYLPQQSTNGKSELTLGWLGSPSTLCYLEKIIPALEKVARQHSGVKLKVVSSVFPKKSLIQMDQKQWKEEEEQLDLASFDIGLAPLQDDLWCKGKCGLKLLQYMAIGIPTVSSPAGGQTEIIQDGENGLLATCLEEWEQKLNRLIEDEQMRKMIGENARKSVMEKYSLEVGVKQLLKVIDELS